MLRHFAAFLLQLLRHHPNLACVLQVQSGRRQGAKVVAAASNVPAIGAGSLGFFVGYMIWYFVVRFAKDKYTSDGLVAVVGVFAGGIVVQFLEKGSTPTQRWWYPIGLVIGWAVFSLFQFINWLATRNDSEDAKAARGKNPPLPALIAPDQHAPH